MGVVVVRAQDRREHQPSDDLRLRYCGFVGASPVNWFASREANAVSPAASAQPAAAGPLLTRIHPVTDTAVHATHAATRAPRSSANTAFHRSWSTSVSDW